jgi:hypothetical protein
VEYNLPQPAFKRALKVVLRNLLESTQKTIVQHLFRLLGLVYIPFNYRHHARVEKTIYLLLSRTLVAGASLDQLLKFIGLTRYTICQG